MPWDWSFGKSYGDAERHLMVSLFFPSIFLLYSRFSADEVDPYEIPYQTVLPNNPSIEQMQEVVCTRKIRPLPSERWKKNPVITLAFLSIIKRSFCLF